MIPAPSLGMNAKDGTTGDGATGSKLPASDVRDTPVAAVTTLASLMLAAAIAIRAHTVMRLRTGECDALELSSFVFRFIFRMPPMADNHRPGR